MKIPREYIIGQRNLVMKLNGGKFIHYRDLCELPPTPEAME